MQHAAGLHSSWPKQQACAHTTQVIDLNTLHTPSSCQLRSCANAPSLLASQLPCWVFVCR